MEKTLLFLLVTLIFVSCGSKTDRESMTFTDDFEVASAVTPVPDNTSVPDKTLEDVSEPTPTRREVQKPAVIRQNDGLYCNHVGRYAEVFNDSNYVQYAAAERLGIDPIESLEHAYRTKRPILKVKSCENYKIDSLTHSVPYLVPEAASLLADIGKAFGDTLQKRGGDRHNRLIVTSLLRTPRTVKRLRRVNRNAVDSSTHVFATTFDISWSHFDCPEGATPARDEILKGILAEVLLDMRSRGRCYVKYEQKSPCFHITVRK